MSCQFFRPFAHAHVWLRWWQETCRKVAGENTCRFNSDAAAATPRQYIACSHTTSAAVAFRHFSRPLDAFFFCAVHAPPTPLSSSLFSRQVGRYHSREFQRGEPSCHVIYARETCRHACAACRHVTVARRWRRDVFILLCVEPSSRPRYRSVGYATGDIHHTRHGDVNFTLIFLFFSTQRLSSRLSALHS